MRLKPSGGTDAVNLPTHGDGGAVEDAGVPHQFSDRGAGDVLAGEEWRFLKVQADILGLAAEMGEEVADGHVGLRHLDAVDRVAVERPDDAAVHARVDCHDELRHEARPLSLATLGQAEKVGDAEGVAVGGEVPRLSSLVATVPSQG
ncbi:MAG: hypothetical protein EBW87_03730 [Burkholderiaceae bacterium]|nr:hypothetical protein [Burkholderiaceae bacterium]